MANVPHEDMTSDKQAALELVKKSIGAFKQLSEELRGDRDVALEAVSRNGLALEWASEELRNDREVVLKAVNHRGHALGYVGPQLKRDEDVVLAAVKKEAEALQFDSRDFRKNKDFMVKAARQNGEAVLFASSELLADKDVMTEAVKRDGSMLKFASQQLLEDRDVVLAAVKSHGCALQHARDLLRADWEIVAEAVKQHGPAWRFASEELQADQDILLLAARHLRDDLPLRYGFDAERQDIVEQGIEREVMDSALAGRGDDAPVISVCLVQRSGPGPGEEPGQTSNFQFEVSTLSGTSFLCDVENTGTADRWGAERSAPIMNDLAKNCIGGLTKHTKLSGVRRVFLNVVQKEVGDISETRTVSPWHWDRPLEDYFDLPGPSPGQNR